MSRRVTYRGRLRFPFGFHTGDGRRLDLSDQPLLREPDGRIALAGTSLAGALRADLRRLVFAAGPGREPCTEQRDCECPLCRLMGPEPPEERLRDGREKSLRASRLHVAGGRSEQPPEVRVRDHVGIDRRTRTAADRRKYDVEVAEAGLELPFELRVDDPSAEDTTYLEAALRRLALGWWFLGGKTSSGLGRVELAALVRDEVDLSDAGALVEYLLADDPAAGGASTTLVPGTGSAWSRGWNGPVVVEGAAEWAQLRLRVELDFPWGFLVNAPVEALLGGTDHAFSRLPDGRPFLPGSALRGALRSRAEQILRTVGGDEAACDLNRKSHACHERIDLEIQGREAPLSFDQEQERHCPACRVFGSGRLVSSVKLTDFHPTSDAGASRLQEFVAIDRLTGGAAEGAKFDAELYAPVTLSGEIHLELSGDRLRPWGLGLVALVLRDLLVGDIPLGFGSAKGLNEYRARITGVDRFWLQPPPALAGLGLEDAPGTRGWPVDGKGDVADPQAVRKAAGEALAGRMRDWVQALHEELARRRGAKPLVTGSAGGGKTEEGRKP